MSNELLSSVVTVILAIIGVAILALLVSPNARTSQVFGAGGQAIGGLIQTALSPVSNGGGGIPTGFNFTGPGLISAF